MKMLTSAVLATMTVLSASAYAASPNIEPNNIPFQGVYGQHDPDGLTRAEVISQLEQAKREGLVTFGELDHPPIKTSAASDKSRSQVLAELAESKANGEYSFGTLDYPPSAG